MRFGYPDSVSKLLASLHRDFLCDPRRIKCMCRTACLMRLLTDWGRPSGHRHLSTQCVLVSSTEDARLEELSCCMRELVCCVSCKDNSQSRSRSLDCFVRTPPPQSDSRLASKPSRISAQALRMELSPLTALQHRSSWTPSGGAHAWKRVHG